MAARKLQQVFNLIQNRGRALFRSLGSHIRYKRDLNGTQYRKHSSLSDNHDTEDDEDLEPLPVYDAEQASRKLHAILKESMKYRKSQSPVYELQSCKAKEDRVTNLSIFDHYKKIYEQQNIRSFPHLQPNRMIPYGTRHSVLIPSQGSKMYKSYTNKIKSSVHKPKEKTQ